MLSYNHRDIHKGYPHKGKKMKRMQQNEIMKLGVLLGAVVTVKVDHQAVTIVYGIERIHLQNHRCWSSTGCHCVRTSMPWDKKDKMVDTIGSVLIELHSR
jgi:hypothetical protein